LITSNTGISYGCALLIAFKTIRNFSSRHYRLKSYFANFFEFALSADCSLAPSRGKNVPFTSRAKTAMAVISNPAGAGFKNRVSYFFKSIAGNKTTSLYIVLSAFDKIADGLRIFYPDNFS